MRKKLIAGNWKMNLHFDEALSLVASLLEFEKQVGWQRADVVLFPPFLYARQAFEFLRQHNSNMLLGLQNCAATDNGAFTGEVSASMAKAAGMNAVIIGHSERRAYFHEGNDILFQKLKRVLEAGLVPFFCCGELLEDRKSMRHFEAVKSQLEQCVFKLSAEEFNSVVIAYEPVWAIGTGETASPEQAGEMHAYIRTLVAEHFGVAIAEKVRILYGGSMNAANAKALLSQPDVDGGLIGGASLKPTDFNSIVCAA